MTQVTNSSNPFDSSFDAGRQTDTSLRVGVGRGGINPFDDEPMTNPFATMTSRSEDEDDDEDDEPTDEEDDDLRIPVGAPVEASWQYLGDLPYRRVPVYSHVAWGGGGGGGGEEDDERNSNGAGAVLTYGLSAFPRSALQRHPEMLNARELRELLNTSTITKVVGCPYGGPIAAVTLPIVGETAWFHQTEIRILTNAGKPLGKIHFPLPGMERKYTPSDIMEIGFTDRAILVIILRDSLCLTYNLQGESMLTPFHILARGEGKGTELYQATIYEGGAAVLSTSKHSAIVEFLDDHDDPTYFTTAHMSSRRIFPSDSKLLPGVVDTSAFAGGNRGDSIPSFCGLVTYLPTAAFASEHFFSYSAIAVLPRTRTACRHPEVFLGTSDNSVVVVNTSTTEVKDLDCRGRISAPIVDMSFAPNGRFLACFTESSILTVISTTFETKVLDFDTSEGSTQPPLEMKWCGEDSVVLHWKNLGVLMVGPYGDWLRFPYENQGNLYLIPEIDCCRVITDVAVELLQRVPPATALLLRIGSIEPSAMLLDASDAFESGSSSSDDAARAITKTGALLEAIEGCTDAAAKEFDILTQKRLLRAASFGMHFSFKEDRKENQMIMGGKLDLEGDKEDALSMPSNTTKRFVATARKLRILNSIRNPNVGMVVTSAQFDAVSATGIIARLVAVKKPALAASISKYLGLPRYVQLFARSSKAAAYVTSVKDLSDSDTAQGAIQIILGETASKGSELASVLNRGGYATVAMAANKANRSGVANMLLMLESSVADKVPVLLSTGSFADAIAVATTARDADYIFYALMEYHKYCRSQHADATKANQMFQSAVVTKFTPEAYNTLKRFWGTSPETKNDINLQLRAQKFTSAGVTVARRAVAKKGDFREKISVLSEAARVFAMGKETNFYKTCTDDYLELLKDQEVLRTKYGVSEVAPESTSVVDTISSILRYAAVNERESSRLLMDAEKVAKKFRVPDKMYWYTKVRAFAETGQWQNLNKLADSKTKPPIGFKPFARAAIQGGRSASEILRYIERVVAPEERYSLFTEAGLWKGALEEAFRLKDEGRIMDVKSRCGSPELQLQADQLLARLA